MVPGYFQLRPQGKPDWSIPDLADFKVRAARPVGADSSPVPTEQWRFFFACGTWQLKPYVQLTVRTDATPEPPPILVGRKGQPPIYPHPGGGPFVPRAAVEAATTGADPSGAAAASAEGGDR